MADDGDEHDDDGCATASENRECGIDATDAPSRDDRNRDSGGGGGRSDGRLTRQSRFKAKHNHPNCGECFPAVAAAPEARRKKGRAKVVKEGRKEGRRKEERKSGG